MSALMIVAIAVEAARLLDPLLKAYYWTVAGTAVLIGTFLMVRCAWRVERKIPEIIEALKRGAG